MTSLYDFLRRRTPEFSITLNDCNTDIKEYIRKQLINSPYLLSTIKDYTYRCAYDHSRNSIVITFSVTYESSIIHSLVFQVRNQLELITAISLMFRFHASCIKIVVDNISCFISEANKNDIIYNAKAMVDEELQTSQISGSSISSSSRFSHKLLIYTLKNAFFNSAKDINDLSCYAAALGVRLRAENQDEYQLLEALREWFVHNVTYQNNHLVSDHSAVGLIINKTGVCQAIAAFAFQVLSFCGIKARCVHGEGYGSDGWGSHAWNMVFINNQWVHIDYTFCLYNSTDNIIKPSTIFRKNHRWNEEFYSDMTSNTYVQTRLALDHSLIVTIPNATCYSVNGCIIDTSNQHPICTKLLESERIYIAIFDVITVCGGYYELKGETVHLYFDLSQYNISFSLLKYLYNYWYCPLSLFESLGFKVDFAGKKVIIQNKN